VSTSAGGGVDTVTRIIGAALQEKLGQPFVIEDRGGGGGNIGAEAVYTADPDGYTLLASQPSPITSNIALYKKLNFDPAALESVAVLSKIPNLLLVRQDFPAKTAVEFIVYAKAHPGGVERFGYRDSPLEVMAYGAEARFVASTAGFDAEELVAENLARVA